jgi:hypothetical protein
MKTVKTRDHKFPVHWRIVQLRDRAGAHYSTLPEHCQAHAASAASMLYGAVHKALVTRGMVEMLKAERRATCSVLLWLYVANRLSIRGGMGRRSEGRMGWHGGHADIST